jgi:hypothetical protein
MLIGLFISAPNQVIPTETDVVHTSGYAAVGSGVAEYIYDVAVDACYVSKNMHTSFVSANGRGFRLNPEKMPPATAFGAVVSATPPNPAVQTANSQAIQAAMYWGPFSLPGFIWCDPAIKLYPWALDAGGMSCIHGVGPDESGLRFECSDLITHACITIPEGYIGADNKLYDACGHVKPSNAGHTGTTTARRVDWHAWSVRTGYGKSATAVFMNNISDSLFSQMSFSSAYRGLFIGVGFNVTVDTCHFAGLYFVAGRTLSQVESGWADAFGLFADDATVIRNVAGTGWGTSIWLNGMGNVLEGARLEAAEYGLRLGGGAFNWDLWNGSNFGPGSPFSGIVQGVTTESNRVGIYISVAINALIEKCVVTGTAGAVPLGRAPLAGVVCSPSVYPGTVLRSVTCSVQHTLWGKFINAGNAVFEDMAQAEIQGSNTVFSKTGIRFSVRHFLKNSTVAEAPDKDHSMSLDSQTMLLGLTGINLRDAPIFAKNLGGTGTCASAATSAAITFPVLRQTGNAGFSMAPKAETYAGSTLSPGTFAYASTILSKRAETGVSWLPFASFTGDVAFKSVTVAAGQRVRMAMVGFSNLSAYRRRIYKFDVAKGYFLGFWEMSATVQSFSDDGNIAFTGHDVPPPGGGSIPAQAEDDTNYEVLVLPSWNTTAFAAAADKLTTGFTVHFGTAAERRLELFLASVEGMIMRADDRRVEVVLPARCGVVPQQHRQLGVGVSREREDPWRFIWNVAPRARASSALRHRRAPSRRPARSRRSPGAPAPRSTCGSACRAATPRRGAPRTDPRRSLGASSCRSRPVDSRSVGSSTYSTASRYLPGSMTAGRAEHRVQAEHDAIDGQGAAGSAPLHGSMAGLHGRAQRMKSAMRRAIRPLSGSLPLNIAAESASSG